MTETTVLIDAYSQIFRSFFAIRQLLTNSKGEPTNALYVFTRLLLKLNADYPGARGAMLFDCGRVKFRQELNPEYKANRPPMPEALKQQIPLMRRMAEAFGWPLLQEQEYEADDLIAAFALAVDGPVRIVTADKDLAQLVDDRVTILAPAPKNGFEVRDRAAVEAKFSVSPALLVDYLALIGDSSDNIPGVPGIGPKGAVALLNEYGPIAGWPARPTLLAGTKFEKKLCGMEERLQRNRELIQLRHDLPEQFAKLDVVLCRREPDWAEITRICREQELKSILKDLPPLPEESAALSAADDEPDLFSLQPEPEPPASAEPSEMEQGELF